MEINRQIKYYHLRARYNNDYIVEDIPLSAIEGHLYTDIAKLLMNIGEYLQETFNMYVGKDVTSEVVWDFYVDLV